MFSHFSPYWHATNGQMEQRDERMDIQNWYINNGLHKSVLRLTYCKNNQRYKLTLVANYLQASIKKAQR